MDLAGNASEANLQVTVANKSAFLITTPAEGDQVGPGANRAIIAVTIGNNGTLPADGAISRVDVYINGLLAGTTTSQTASDGSRIFVYIWDTRNAVGGHDPVASGDRVISARVFYAGKDTWTNGVRVTYLP